MHTIKPWSGVRVRGFGKGSRGTGRLGLLSGWSGRWGDSSEPGYDVATAGIERGGEKPQLPAVPLSGL